MNHKTITRLGIAAIVALLAGCATTQTAEGPLLVEAEATAFEGNIVVNGMPDGEAPMAEGSGDVLYMQDSGAIPFVFDIPAAGEYLVKIYYAIPASYGDKMNHIEVNGEYIEEASFPQTNSEFEAKWVGILTLQRDRMRS